jgi:hypothetical protein
MNLNEGDKIASIAQVVAEEEEGEGTGGSEPETPHEAPPAAPPDTPAK